MKKLKYAICISVMVLACTAVLLFLNTFTAASDQSMNFIEFTTYSLKHEDGTLTKISSDEFYAIVPEKDQEFVFTAVITEENYDDYIQFTPTGMDISVKLGDTDVYHSASVLPDEVIDQITSRIPIRGMEFPLTVTMECRYLGGVNTIFPPMLFTTSDTTEMMQNLSWGHRGGIPAGAFAVVFLLLVAFFLYSIIEGKAQYSLIALLFSSAILMVYGICCESGYLFLPDWMNTLFVHNELLWLLTISFLIYFALNYKRAKLFSWCALISSVVFVFTYLISFAANGSFSKTVSDYIKDWIEIGEYTRPLIWINYWLQFICVFVAGTIVVRSISEHFSREQTFELNTKLAMDNYRVIEEQSRHDAVLRHEFNNYITSIKLMLEQNKTEDALRYLDELEERNLSITKFTGNFAINAILQNAAARSEELNIKFEAYARAEDNLSIPESDLCGLLFNMLDNAFEALAAIDDPQKRRLSIRIKQRDSALGIYCENSYQITPEYNHNGKLITHKNEYGHGIGMEQMELIAARYKGKLDFSYSDDSFIVQTVLFLK